MAMGLAFSNRLRFSAEVTRSNSLGLNVPESAVRRMRTSLCFLAATSIRPRPNDATGKCACAVELEIPDPQPAKGFAFGRRPLRKPRQDATASSNIPHPADPVSKANTSPNRLHKNRTVPWLISPPLFMQQVFDVAQRQWKTNVNHHRKADDFRARRKVTIWAAFCQPEAQGGPPALFNQVLSDSA